MNRERMARNAGFDAYYANIYGPRWKGLRESLLLPAVSVAYGDGLAVPYYLDRSSVLAACSLRLPEDAAEEGDAPGKAPLVLDACAAPGGKSLVIASRMGKNSGLLSNEISAERRRRLGIVLDKHLFPETRSRVTVSGFDAAAAAGRQSERGRFAAVLLDAPCSSERHVIAEKTAMENWTAARPRFLAGRQWALLSASFLLLENGGSLVYVTCSLNPDENDGVASRLMSKYGGQTASAGQGDEGSPREACCVLDKPGFGEGEETEYGRIILPDTSGGCGPLYTARFKKALIRR